MIKHRHICFFLFVFFSSFQAAAEDTTQIIKQNSGWNTVERSNFSRYDNGKYIGHVYREVRASISPEGEARKGYVPYRANYIVLEETLRDMRQSARSVNNVVPVRFLMSHNGAISIEDDRGFPSLRDFPIFDSSITTGKKWIAAGKCAVDPLNDGNVITYPFLAEYEYKGTEDYQNIPVHHINAKYASRMKGPGVQGEDQLTSLNGSHNVDIFISVADGTPVFQRDYLDETYSWRSGKSVRLSGFILTFGNRSIKLDIKTKKEIEEGFVTVKGVDVVPLDTGLRLTVKELQFKSDSDELAAGEKNRLDAIAAVLAKAPADKTFLVEGHTAAIGHGKNEMELSLRRAKRIVAEMTMRGIMEQRFIYRGSGGTKPVGDNASETGRAQNRRVEITILE